MGGWARLSVLWSTTAASRQAYSRSTRGVPIAVDFDFGYDPELGVAAVVSRRAVSTAVQIVCREVGGRKEARAVVVSGAYP